jgi:hypothetical protein
MTICEYCGRLHHVTHPDARFCSLFCRTQYGHEQTPLLSLAVSAQELRLTQADRLADHILGLSADARRLLDATPTLASDPHLRAVHTFLCSLAEDVDIAQAIHQYLANHPADSPT